MVYYDDRQSDVHAHNTVVPPDFQHWMTTNLYFHGFQKLQRGHDAINAFFHCLDHEWMLRLSPFGDERYEKPPEEEAISLILSHTSDEHIHIEFGFAIKDDNNDKVSGGISSTTTCMFLSYTKKGYSQFMLRQQALENLVQGALVVEVRMKPIKKCSNSSLLPPFVPKNPSNCKVIQDLFMHEESADVVFEVEVLVDGKQETSKGRKKVQKTMTSSSSPTFYAHRNILSRAAPQLADLCTTSSSSSSANKTPALVQIPNISAPNFHRLLLYVYGFEVPDLDKNSKEMIEVANKYGIINLKLEAEAQYISSITLNFSNMMEHLLFADSMSCEALKEAVMDFIAMNREKILKRNLLKDAPAGLINDVMVAMARVEKDNKYDSDSEEMGIQESEELSTMRIRELRGRAHAKGLEVDGSREALISAIQKASRKKKV